MLELTVEFSPDGAKSDNNCTTSARVELTGGTAYNAAGVKTQVAEFGAIFPRAVPVGGVVRGVVVRELDAKGAYIKNHAYRVPIDLAGTWAVPANSVMSKDYMVAQFRKVFDGMGRGFMQMRSVMTEDEVSTYNKTRAVPVRFEPASGTARTAANSITFAIKEKLNTGLFKFHMPDARDDNNAIVKRPVSDLTFGGIVKADKPKGRQSYTSKTIEAAQSHISKFGRGAKRAWKPNAQGEYTADTKNRVKKLKTDAYNVLNSLDPVDQGYIVMPSIFEVVTE